MEYKGLFVAVNSEKDSYVDYVLISTGKRVRIRAADTDDPEVSWVQWQSYNSLHFALKPERVVSFDSLRIIGVSDDDVVTFVDRAGEVQKMPYPEFESTILPTYPTNRVYILYKTSKDYSKVRTCLPVYKLLPPEDINAVVEYTQQFLARCRALGVDNSKFATAFSAYCEVIRGIMRKDFADYDCFWLYKKIFDMFCETPYEIYMSSALTPSTCADDLIYTDCDTSNYEFPDGDYRSTEWPVSARFLKVMRSSFNVHYGSSFVYLDTLDTVFNTTSLMELKIKQGKCFTPTVKFTYLSVSKLDLSNIEVAGRCVVIDNPFLEELHLPKGYYMIVIGRVPSLKRIIVSPNKGVQVQVHAPALEEIDLSQLTTVSDVNFLGFAEQDKVNLKRVIIADELDNAGVAFVGELFGDIKFELRRNPRRLERVE